MNNKYNINLITQYKNEELYEEELFTFILNKTDLNELKNNSFDIDYQQSVSIKGNFEAFLEKGIEYDYPFKREMYQKIQEKWHKELLTPLYFIQLDKKEYILEKSGYEIFRNINNYVKYVVENKIQRLNDSEEKFVIDWFFKEPPKIYLHENQKKEIEEIYQILYHQKEYLNKKNDKSKVNNFFENHGMKRIFALFTIEQRNSLMNEQLTTKEIITTYYKKLLRQKHFDLANQLINFPTNEIIKELKEQVSTNEKEWFKAFLEKGSALSLNDLQKKFEGKHVPLPYKEKPKVSAALQGGIDLFKKLLPEITDISVTYLMFVAVIESQNERLYLELRSIVELPQDDKFRQYINQKTIHKKSIDMIEKEVLKNKLEDKFDAKPKVKPTKI